MSTIATLCTSIMQQLIRLRVQHSMDDVLPGISEEQLRILTSELPFTLPRSVIELYKWSEGPRTQIGSLCFPGYSMESLSFMVETYRELSAASDYPRFRVGDRQWFPVFRSGGTDYYGVCCRNTATVDGEIIDDDNEGAHRDCVTPPDVKFVSLESMLRTVLRCFETDVFFVNEHGFLDVGVATYFADGPLKGCLKDVDLTRFNEVARQFNPGLKCWL